MRREGEGGSATICHSVLWCGDSLGVWYLPYTARFLPGKSAALYDTSLNYSARLVPAYIKTPSLKGRRLSKPRPLLRDLRVPRRALHQ